MKFFYPLCKLKKSAFLTFLLSVLFTLNSNALTVYSVASGNWSSSATWSNLSGGPAGAAAPAIGDDVVIEGGFTVTLDANTVALTSILVSSGSTFTATSNFTISSTSFTINGTYINNSTGAVTVTTMNVNGTWTNNVANAVTATPLNMNNGCTYNHAFNGGDITGNQAATWGITSTCNITGTINTVPGNLGQNFGNFIWNCTSQTGANQNVNALTTVLGNFSIVSTGTGQLRFSNNGNSTLAIGRDFLMQGGTFRCSIGTGIFAATVSGSYIQTGGTFDFGAGSAASTMSLLGDFTLTAGTFTETSTGNGTLSFTGGTTQIFTNTGTITNNINFNVNSPSILQIATATTIIPGGGTFTLAAGATLGIKSTAGITTTGATGNIQVTGVRTYTTGANYIYNGTANQACGNGLTQNTPLNVTINNAGNTVAMSAATTISGLMSVTAGTLNMNNFAATVGSLTGNGTITNSGATGQTFTVGSNNTSTTFSGIIQNGTSTVSLTKIGTGTLTLSGTNTYTGVTTINAGTLSVATIGNGGVSSNLGAATTAAANLVLGGGTLRYTGATASTNRAFTLTALTTSTIDVVTNDLTISGVSATTTGALTKIGNGKLILSGANGYSGLTTITAGTLEFGVNSALAGGSVTVNGGILDIKSFNDAVGVVTLVSGSILGTTGVLTGSSYDVQSGNITAILAGAVTLTKSTAGTVTMSGASTYTGTTTITGGILSVNSIQNVSGGASALGAPTTAGNGTIAMAAGTTLQYTGSGHSSNRVINLTGTGAILDASGSGALTLSGGITGDTFTIILTGTGNATESGVIATTTGGLTKNGTGTWTLSGLNSYTGANNINAGVLSVNTIGNGSANSSIGAALVAATNLVIGAATLQYTGATAITNRAFSLTNGANSIIDVTTNNLTFSAVSGNGTSGRLIKEGNGTLTLTANNNTWTGGTTLNAGTLAFSDNQGLGTVAGTLIINGGAIDNVSGGTLTTVNYPIQLNGNFTFTGTNNLNFGTGAVVISNDPTITTTASTLTIGGAITPSTVSLTKAGAGTLAFGTNAVSLNNLTISTGTLTSTSGTLTLAGNFSNSGTYTNNAGTVVFSGASSILGTSTTTFNNLQLNGSTTITTTPIINGTLTMQEGGSVSSGSVTYGAAGILRYNGTSGFTTSDGEFPSASGPLSVNINNSGNITLHASRTLASPGTLTLTSGRFILGSNNFTISNTATAAIIAGSAFSATNMIQADGTGQLIRATVAASYLYPVGDATGTVEYSPATFNFTTNATARNIGVRVVNAAHPQLNNTPVQSDYITRYWPVTNSNAAGNYTYNVSLTYQSADLVGSYLNVRLDKYTGASWEQDAASSSTAGFVLTANGMTQTTLPITNASTNEFTGRVNDGSTYTWNQTVSGTWNGATNWTPTRTTPAVNDILIFNNGATTTVTNLQNQTISKILFTSNTNINLQSSFSATLIIAGGNGNDFAIDAGSSLNIGTTGANTTRIFLANAPNCYINGTLTITANNGFFNEFDNTNSTLTSVAGTINNAGIFTNTNAAKLTFTGTAAYNHNHTTASGIIPTATWASTTTTSILSYTNNNTTPSGLGQSFGNFVWNCPAQTNNINFSGALTTIQNNFTVTATNTGSLRLTGNTVLNMTIGGNLTVTAGTLTITNGTSSNTVTVTGNVVNTGNINLALGSSGSTNLICNNFSHATGTFDFGSGSGSSSVNAAGTFNYSSGTLTQSGTGTNHTINFNGSTLQSITLFSSPATDFNYTFNNAAGFTLNSNFTVNNNRTLTHTAGAIGGAGAITYGATATNLVYNGTTNYTTTNKEWPAANGPINVTLNKTGGAGNNVVTLHAARTLATGTLTLTQGVLSLGSNNLTISNTATNAIVAASPSATQMIAAEGTGQLLRGIAAGGNNYVFPIGDVTGTPEYAGISINFSFNIFAGVLGFRCPDGRNANDSTTLLPAVDLTTRSWLSTYTSGGLYGYTPTISYASPGDVYGTEENMLVSNWTGTAWNTRASVVTPGIPTSTINTTADVLAATLSLNNAIIIGRAPIKYWKGDLSNDWSTAGNWVPSGVPIASDNVQIPFFTNFPCVLASGSQTVNHFDVSGTGSLTVSSGATLSVGGNFTFDNSEGATATFDCGSTLNISNGTYTQSIPALSYGNLNVAGGNRILASTGTIGICNNYTPSAGTTTTTGSTVSFNGTTAQAINTNAAAFNNLTITNPSATVTSNVAVTVATGGTLSINGNAANTRLNMGTNTLTLTGATANITSGNLRTGGTVTGGTRIFGSNGTYEHNYTTNAGTIPTSTWNTGSTCAIIGYTTGGPPAGLGQTFSNFTWNCANQSANINLAGALTAINGNFTVSSTNASSLQLISNNAVHTLTIGGDFILNAGTLDIRAANNQVSTFNVAGNFAINGGTFTKSGGNVVPNVNFNNATATQTFFDAGTISGDINWNVNGTSNTVQLTSNVGLGTGNCIFVVGNGTTIDFQNFVLSGSGTFISNAGSTLKTGNANGFVNLGTASGSVQTTNARTYNATANYIYNGAIAQNTGTGLTAAFNLTFDNTSGAVPAVTLTSNATISGTLTLTNGIVRLGTNNLTLSATTAASVSGGSSTAFIQTNSTGQLRRTISTAFAPSITYNFPVGTSTDYTPASFTFTANNTAGRILRVRAVAATHPQMNTPNSQLNYLANRYWETDLSSIAGTYSYTSAFTFLSGDVVGSVSNINLNRYNQSTLAWTENATSSAAGTVLSSGNLTNVTFPLTVAVNTAAQWTGRVNNKTYTWNGSVSSAWGTGANWTPAGPPTAVDNVILNVPGTNQLNLTTAVNIYDIELSGTGVLNISSSGTLTTTGNFTYDGSSGAVANLNAASTVNIANTVSQPVPDLNFGNLNLGTGIRVLSPTGTIGIAGTYTPTTGALTTTGSTIAFNGAAQNIPTSTFNNLIIAGTGNKTLTGNLTINGDLSVNANTLDVSTFTANRASAGGTLTIANGATLKVGGTNTFPNNYSAHSIGCTSTIEYSGTNQTIADLNSSQAYGNLVLSGSGTKTLQVGTTNICNDFTTSGTCSTTGVVGLTIGRNITIGSGTTFIAGSFTHSIAGNFARTGTFTSTGSTIQFNGSSAQQITGATTFDNLTLNNAAGLTLNNATTVSSVLNLTSGNITLGTNDLTISSDAAGAITGTFSNTNMIVADNTGQLIRATVSGTNYTYPIGDATGTTEYSPVAINFSAKSATSNIGFRVVDAVHPSVNAVTSQTDYLSRYWVSSNSSTPTYTYTATFDYVAADVNGSAVNIRINKWDGSNWTQALLSSSTANQLSLVTSETNTRMSFSSTAEFTGRVMSGQTYTWNQTGTGSYVTSTNWTPTRTTPLIDDILAFNNAATTTVTNVPTESISQLLISNNTNVSLTSTGAGTLTIVNGNGTDFQVAAGSTLNISSSNGLSLGFANACIGDLAGTLSLTGSSTNAFNTTNSITTVNGTINNAGVITGSITSLLFNAASTYNHNWTTAVGSIPLATWNATSNTNITSYTTGGGADFAPSNLNQSFGNFSWNCPSQSNDAQLNGALTSIAGNLSILNTNGSDFKFANASTTIINIGGNFTNSANTIFSSGIGADITINLAGNYTQSSGLLNLGKPSSSTTNGSFYVAGNFNFSGGTITQTAAPTNGGVALIEFNGASAQTISSSGTINNAINFRLNNAAGANLTGTLFINQNASFYLKNGTLSGTGACSYNATVSNLVYEGTTALNTSDVEWPATNTPTNVNINTTSTVTLNSNKQLGATAILTETAGLLKLGAFDLTVANTSTSAIVNASPSTTNMIVTDGAGKLKRGIAAGANTYLFPLGDVVGTTQYTPISLNFSANSTSRIVGFRVADAASANINVPNVPIDYLSRTWYSSENGAGGTYTYVPTLTYAASGDIIGLAANSIFASWDGSGWVVFPTTRIASTISTTSAVSEASGSVPLTNAELTSRSPIVYWIGGVSTNWNTAANWSPAAVPTSADNIVISNLAVNDCELTGTGNAFHFTLNGTKSFHATSAATLSILGNLNRTNTAGFTFDCSSTLNILNTVENQFVPATNYGNLNLGTGTRTLDTTGVINICNNFTNTTGTLHVTNSTLNFNGTTAQTLTGGGSFYNLKVNNSAGVTTTGNINVSDTLNLTSGKITIGNNDLTLAGTGLVLNGNSSSYVKTNGTGRFKQTVSSTANTFHIGNSSYNPITLTNNGTTDIYGIKVVDAGVGTENDNTKIVNRHWDVSEAVAGGSNLDVTAQWNAPVAQAGEEASSFVRADTYKYMGLYQSSAWTTNAATLSGSNPYTYSATGFTTVGKFELGSSDAFKTFYFTAANGNWNAGGTWVGGVSPALNAAMVIINHNVTVTATPPAINELVIGTGSIAINSAQTLQINTGGKLTNTHSSAVNITGVGSLEALGTLAIIASANPINIDNLKLSGASTINGDLYINSSLFMKTAASINSGAPIYNTGSTLIYDVSSTTFSRSNEWSYNGYGITGTSAGYPYHVTLRNVSGGFVGNTFNPGANSGSVIALSCEGNLTLEDWTYFNMNISGSEMTAPIKVKGNITLGTSSTGGRLTASSLSGGDVYCGGNFNCENGGALLSFVANGRTLYMNGSSNQNFYDNNGLNPLSKLVIDKTSGDVKISDFCAINGNSGDVLEIINNGGLDLNGIGINLTGNGGNILVSGGSRNIINSSVTACNINVSGSKTVTSTSSGTLNIGNNINVALTSGIDFGSNLTTINGTLAILPSGVVNNNAPNYSNTSTLEYSTGSSLNRGIEWNSTSGAGYPNNVNITANVTGTTLNLGTGTASPTIAGALTIAAGCTVNMQALASPLTVNGNIALTGVTAALNLSSAPGGNLLCGGNLTIGGATFTNNSREVEMIGTSGIQDITGISSFDYLKINNSGTSVRLNAANTTINNRLWLLNGTLDLNTKTLTLATNSLVRRSASAATLSAAPTPTSTYDLQYDATLTTGPEFVASTTAIRNLEITAGTLSLSANSTINNDLTLSGGDLDLGSNTFTTYGNATAPAFAGSISVSGGGTRNISGSGIFNITGTGGNNPAMQTKQFSSTGGSTLIFASGVTVNIGDGEVDFGTGNPVTINGTLKVLTAGSVGSTLNACNYGTGSTLIFDNGVDYTITSSDNTWKSGTSGAGVPYNVSINGATTDVNMNDDRSIRNDLTITDGKLHTASLTNGITIKGNWTRTGASSAFDNAANGKVTFNGTSIQTITAGSGNTNETFYDLALNNAAGVALGASTDLTVANDLIFTAGKLDIGTSSNNITIDGAITGAGSSKYINTNYAGAGYVNRSAASNGAYTFPVGDASNYTPITITLNAGAQAGAYLKAKSIDAVHPTASFGANYLSRYFTLEETGLTSSFNYDVTYTYTDADVNGSESMIYPYKLHTGNGPGAGWLGPYGSDAAYPYGGYTQDATNNIFTWSGLINFSDLTGGGGGTPQPITLLYFNAKANNEQVDLSWSTISEVNNDYFEVQRSVNGKDFESIDKIAGAGNHKGELNYNSFDENPYNGISYYRLKQVDFDGKTSYSTIKMVEINKGNETLPVSIQLYPNPSKDGSSTIVLDRLPENTIVTVTITDMLGKQAAEDYSAVSSNGSIKLTLNTESFNAGIYLVRIHAGSDSKVIRWIVEK
jgi:autotransporter-associated beta strand protein